jgi:structural maintenance of chromosome 1
MVAEPSCLMFSCSFRPSLFFVLEVDATLDDMNVANAAAYIHAKLRPEMKDSDGGKDIGFESVVISLKDTFYDKADALIGVYRDER